MRTVPSKLWCPECNEIRIRTATGMVCPNGHGRIHPPATARQIKSAHRLRWAATLPIAKKASRGKYAIEGKPGSYRIVPYAQNSIGLWTKHVPTNSTCNDGVIGVIIGEYVLIRKFARD